MTNISDFRALATALTLTANAAGAHDVNEVLKWDSNGVGCGISMDGGIGDNLNALGLNGISMDGFTGVEEAAAKLNEYAKARIEGFMNPTGYHEIRQAQDGSLYFGVQGFMDLDPSSGARPNAACIFEIPERAY